jgi:hypothetical protein
MSVPAKPMRVDIDYELDVWNKNRHNYKLIETLKIGITDFDIYLFNLETYVEIYVVRDDDPDYKITGDITDDDGLEISKCVRLSQTPIYMDDVYDKVILRYFEYILSDNLHTGQGYAIYKKLTMHDNINVSVYNYNTDKIVATNVKYDELDQYYGSGKGNFLFKISKTKQ